MTDARRRLPSVDRVLAEPGVAALLDRLPRPVVLEAVRTLVARARTGDAPLPAAWPAAIEAHLAATEAPPLQPVLNATGVVVHTNLGRAPLAAEAVAAVTAVAQGYSSLELDLATGDRGGRGARLRRRLAEVAGAEDALVVNNAAGALVLALNALADGREVPISRGELVEIGGGFRIPDIMARAGVRLVEVGTTNRTIPDDYARALGPCAGAVLTVHRSNFELRGFVATPEPAALAALARARGVPYIHDVGSGLLLDLAPWGLAGEPLVRDIVAAGADVVLFSGDKLLGGPQAGCLVGRREAIARCRGTPLARALRADKLTLAALEATLDLYRDPAAAVTRVPVLRMLTAPLADLQARAERIARLLPIGAAVVRPDASTVGGGAFPTSALPTACVAVRPGALGAAALLARLRRGAPPVVARIADDEVRLDPRTLPPEHDAAVAAAVTDALEG